MGVVDEDIAEVVLPIQYGNRQLDPPALPRGKVGDAFCRGLQELAGAPVGPVRVISHEQDPSGDYLMCATTVWRSVWQVPVGRSHWDVANEALMTSVGVHGEVLSLSAKVAGIGTLTGKVHSRGNACTVTIGGRGLTAEQRERVRKVFEEALGGSG